MARPGYKKELLLLLKFCKIFKQYKNPLFSTSSLSIRIKLIERSELSWG